jgi:hypothetical protein
MYPADMNRIRKVEGWSFLVGGAVLATFGLGFLDGTNVWMLGGGAVMILLGIMTLERRK